MARNKTKDPNKKPIIIDLTPEIKAILRLEAVKQGHLYVKPFIENLCEMEANRISKGL